MVILHLSSGLKECGIGDYTTQFLAGLPGEHRRVGPHEPWPLDGVEVVHVQFFGGGFPEGKLGPFRDECRQRRVPFVATLHNCLALLPRLQPDHLFVHTSASLAEALTLGFSSAQITHIPHGVPHVVRAGEWEGDTLVLFGFLLPHKGVLETLEAVQQLRERRPELRLLLQTPFHPPNRAASQRLAEEVAARIHQFQLSDQVEFGTDFLSPEALNRTLSRAAIFLFPYTSDAAQPSSAAARLGMAYGRPSVLSQLPLFEGVRGARWVRPGDPLALAQAVDTLLEGEAAADAVDEAKRGAQKAAWPRVGEQVAAVYQEEITRLKSFPPLAPLIQQPTGCSSIQFLLPVPPPERLPGQRFFRFRAGGRVPLSFSHVLTGWARELLRLGHRVGVEGLAPEHERGLSPDLPDRAEADWEINFTYPPRFQFSATARRRAEVLCWETTHYPEHWAQLTGGLDRVITLSPFSQQALVRSGVDPGRIGIVPAGVDRAIFTPDGARVDWGIYGASPGVTVFFQMGALDSRKGTPLLVQAYLRAFTGDDHTLLFIKNNSFAHYYNLPELVAERVAERHDRHQLPARIEVRSEDWPPEVLAAHMRSASVGVFPYYAEGGFGLPPLEMLACGVPVMVSDFGAPIHYVDAANGWRLPGRLVASEFRSQHHIEHAQARWFLPDEEALIAALQAVHAMAPEERAARGAAGFVTAHSYRWAAAAETLLEVLE